MMDRLSNAITIFKDFLEMPKENKKKSLLSNELKFALRDSHESYIKECLKRNQFHFTLINGFASF